MSINSRVSVLIDVYSSSTAASPSPSSASSSSSAALLASSHLLPSSSGVIKKPRDPATIAQSTQLPHVPTYEPLPLQSQQPASSSLHFVRADDDSLPTPAASHSLHLSGKKRQRTAEVEELLVQLRMETKSDQDTRTPSHPYWSSSAVMPAHDSDYSPSTSAQMSQSPADEPSTSSSVNNLAQSNVMIAASSASIRIRDRLAVQVNSHLKSQNPFVDVVRGLVQPPSLASSTNEISTASPEPSSRPLVSTFVLDHLSRVHVPSLCSEFPSLGVSSELLSLILLCQFPLTELPSHGPVPDVTFQKMLKQLQCESDSHLHYLFQTHLSAFQSALPLSASSTNSQPQSHLHSHSHSAGSSSSSSLAANSITPTFKHFYLQCFPIIRQLLMPPHAKFIPMSIANHYLSLILLPRSPSHMYPFRAFLHHRVQSSTSSSDQLRMSRDQWSCCLEWITSIDAHTLDGYEKEGSWPILMDDFVQWIWNNQQGQSQSKSSPHADFTYRGASFLQPSASPSTPLSSTTTDVDMGSMLNSTVRSSFGSTDLANSTASAASDVGSAQEHSFSPMLLTRSASRLGLRSPLWRMQQSQADIASGVLSLDDDQAAEEELLQNQNHNQSVDLPNMALAPYQLHMAFTSSNTDEFVSDTPGDTRMTE